VPELQPIGNGQEVACWFPLQSGERLQQAAHA